LTIETIEKNYPNIFKALPEDTTELRYLLVIDENYNDEDTDEFDAIDPEDYNYLVYVTDLLQEVAGESVMIELAKDLKEHKDIDEFYLSEIDLYGIQTTLDKDGIADTVLSTIEGYIA
jgi:disulfide oxidoreductase YuzD